MSVNPLLNYDGLNQAQAGGANPPDTNGAANANFVVEPLNTAIRVLNKNTGAVLSTQTLQAFFNEPGGAFVFDPSVLFDENAFKWIVIAAEANDATGESFILFATSKTSSPLGAWEIHKIDVSEPAFNGIPQFGDYPHMGYDADGIYITMNDFDHPAGGPTAPNSNHVSLLTINKQLAEDGNPNTFQRFLVDLQTTDFSLQPAIMHGAGRGAPMYFVEAEPGSAGGAGTSVDVVKMTNKVTAHPVITHFNIHVPAYSPPNDAAQMGGAPIETGDTRMLKAAWRNGVLVAAHSAGDPNDGNTVKAHFYQFSTLGGVPALRVAGEVNPGAGVSTWMPSIDIAGNGTIGLTYMQSSATQFMSMFVTGRTVNSTVNLMQPPILVRAGEATFLQNTRSGDYSGLVVDPGTGTFVGVSEFALADGSWGTHITRFRITAV